MKKRFITLALTAVIGLTSGIAHAQLFRIPKVQKQPQAQKQAHM